MPRIYITKLKCREHYEALALSDANAKAPTTKTDEFTRTHGGRIAGSYRIVGDKECIRSAEDALRAAAFFETFNTVDETMGPELTELRANLYAEARKATGLTNEQIDERYWLAARVLSVCRTGEDFNADIVFEFINR